MREADPGRGNPDSRHVRADRAQLGPPYVSPLVLSHAERPSDGYGAVAQIDIGRFTKTVESYSRHGPLALESIADLIGRCFGTLVDAVTRYGGVVHTFPGDAVIAVWESEEAGLYEQVGRAVACAFELAATRLSYHQLPLKAGIGAGRLEFRPLGAPGGRRELLLTGPAVVDMGRALQRAAAGQVVLSPTAARSAPAAVRGIALGGGALRVTAAPLPALVAPRFLGTHATAAAADFLPPLLRARLAAGLDDWLGEFRRASTLFVDLGEGTADEHAAIYASLLETIRTYDGTIVQVCHDDKGVVALAAFGVETAHEDDADRAVGAALLLHDVLRAAGRGGHVGVTTARLFCGLLGGAARLEYRLLGNAVNVAARLMSRHRGVLCDEATRKLCRRARFAPPQTLALAGLPPLTTYRPEAEAVTAHDLPERFRRGSSRLLICGRHDELAYAHAWLEEGAGPNVRQPTVFAILGEAGIGKTQLASQIAQAAQRARMSFVVCQNEEFASRLALRPFRAALEQLLDLRDCAAATRRERLLRAVAAASGSVDLAPLLEEICPCGLEDTAATSRLDGASRADNRLGLLVQVLTWTGREALSHGTPILVFLEDVHWMDATSWALLQALAQADQPTLRFVVTLRAVPSEIPGATTLLAGPMTRTLRLTPLASSAITEMIAAQLAAQHVTPQLTSLVLSQTGGNPLFCEELLRSLQEQGVVATSAGTAHVVPGAADPSRVVPIGVETILRTRMDRLPPMQLRVLGSASVLGQRFRRALLERIFPARASRDLDLALNALVASGLLTHDPNDASDTYEFRHATTREVAYMGLLHKHRYELHAQIAAQLEIDGTGGRSALEIFHHWRAANESGRALQYVDSGGSEALREGDYRAACEFYTYGVGVLTDLREPDDRRAATWLHHLGEAEVALGRHAEGRRHLEQALRHLGLQVPRHAFNVSAAIVVEIARQVRHRLLAVTTRVDAEVAARGAAIYEQLGYVYYASGDTLRGVHAALGMLNLAEQAPPSPTRARAFAAMSLTLSVTPLRRHADFYERAAREICTLLEDEAVSGWVEWIAAARAAGEARWPQSMSGTAAALAAAERSADQRLAVMASLTRAWALRIQGEVSEARQLARAALKLARAHGNLLWEAWALLADAECDLARQAHVAVHQSSQRALDILAEESDHTEEIRAGGLLAQALLAQNQEVDALRTAERTARAAHAVDLTTFILFEGFAGICEVYLAFCETPTSSTRPRRRRVERRAARACAALARFARVFPVALPRSWCARGRLLAATGQRRRARRAFARALAEATRLAMPRERALAAAALLRAGLTLPAAGVLRDAWVANPDERE